MCGFCKVPAFSPEIEFENKERSKSGMGMWYWKTFPNFTFLEISGSVFYNFEDFEGLHKVFHSSRVSKEETGEKHKTVEKTNNRRESTTCFYFSFFIEGKRGSWKENTFEWAKLFLSSFQFYDYFEVKFVSDYRRTRLSNNIVFRLNETIDRLSLIKGWHMLAANMKLDTGPIDFPLSF